MHVVIEDIIELCDTQPSKIQIKSEPTFNLFSPGQPTDVTRPLQNQPKASQLRHFYLLVTGFFLFPGNLSFPDRLDIAVPAGQVPLTGPLVT